MHDAVFLLALARHAVTDDLGYLKPYHDFDKTLAPLPECRRDILSHLYARGLIAISPDSDVDAFEFDETVPEIESHNAARVLWTFLPGLEGEAKREYLKRLKTLVSGGDWPDGWSRDVFELWHVIAKNECLEFLAYLLAQRRYKPHPLDQKTSALFDALLVDFPPSRIFYLCWKGVTKTIDDFAKQNSYYRNRSKDRFIGAIQRKADEAKAQGRELPHFGRNYHCPQTDVSATFFNDFLNLGNDAFTIIPPRPDGGCGGHLNLDQYGPQAADSPGPV